MKKIIDKLIRLTDLTISGTIGKQLLFFTLTVIIVFTILIAALALLSPPIYDENDFINKFKNTFFSFFEISSFWTIDDFIFPEIFFIIINGLLSKVLFIGVLVTILVNAIMNRINRVKNGEVYYSFSKHIVVIGFDHICKGLITQLAGQNEIVLQTSMDVQIVRHKLFSGLDEKLRKKITIVAGNRMSCEDIGKLHIEKCAQVFLLGEINDENHDSQNIECLCLINKIASDAKKNIRCNTLFNHHLTYAAFLQHDIPGIRNNIDFVPFSFYDIWARKIFVENSYNNGEIIYKSLDHQPITADSDMNVHLVILGMSNMGIALGMQAAQICHFPNFITKGIKTRITFIDETADYNFNLLKRRLYNFFDEYDYSFRCFDEDINYNNFSQKNKFTDIEFEFIKAHFEDDSIQRYLKEASLQKNSFLTVAVALSESSTALAAALYLPSIVYNSGAHVLVRQKQSCAIVTVLSHEEEGTLYCKYKNLRPFGMHENSFNIKHTDDLLPMMIKYVYDNTTESCVIKEFPEDTIRKNWIENWKKSDNLSALKASNRYAANFISVKQRSLGIEEGKDMTAQQIELAAQMEHNRWVAEKLLFGYRSPAPDEITNITNENKREYYKAHFIHEDIKPYKDLEKDEKTVSVKNYDINISSAVPYMIAAYNKKNNIKTV
ncbi:MAG: hypothetical protein FWD47_10325 [Treponema sp.]|nr:hypothetical protein [Treponema sp.]